jgi:predicted transcriptional regulator
MNVSKYCQYIDTYQKYIEAVDMNTWPHIIEQRHRKKMTQEQVAIITGMPQSTIARIEGLTHGLPKLSTLKKIADALDAQVVVKLQATGTKLGR